MGVEKNIRQCMFIVPQKHISESLVVRWASVTLQNFDKAWLHAFDKVLEHFLCQRRPLFFDARSEVINRPKLSCIFINKARKDGPKVLYRIKVGGA